MLIRLCDDLGIKTFHLSVDSTKSSVSFVSFHYKFKVTSFTNYYKLYLKVFYMGVEVETKEFSKYEDLRNYLEKELDNI